MYARSVFLRPHHDFWLFSSRRSSLCSLAFVPRDTIFCGSGSEQRNIHSMLHIILHEKEKKELGSNNKFRRRLSKECFAAIINYFYRHRQCWWKKNALVPKSNKGVWRVLNHLPLFLLCANVTNRIWPSKRSCVLMWLLPRSFSPLREKFMAFLLKWEKSRRAGERLKSDVESRQMKFSSLFSGCLKISLAKSLLPEEGHFLWVTDLRFNKALNEMRVKLDCRFDKFR